MKIKVYKTKRKVIPNAGKTDILQLAKENATIFIKVWSFIQTLVGSILYIKPNILAAGGKVNVQQTVQMIIMQRLEVITFSFLRQCVIDRIQLSILYKNYRLKTKRKWESKIVKSVEKKEKYQK